MTRAFNAFAPSVPGSRSGAMIEVGCAVTEEVPTEVQGGHAGKQGPAGVPQRVQALGEPGRTYIGQCHSPPTGHNSSGFPSTVHPSRCVHSARSGCNRCSPIGRVPPSAVRTNPDAPPARYIDTVTANTHDERSVPSPAGSATTCGSGIVFRSRLVCTGNVDTVAALFIAHRHTTDDVNACSMLCTDDCEIDDEPPAIRNPVVERERRLPRTGQHRAVGGGTGRSSAQPPREQQPKPAGHDQTRSRHQHHGTGHDQPGRHDLDNRGHHVTIHSGPPQYTKNSTGSTTGIVIAAQASTAATARSILRPSSGFTSTYIVRPSAHRQPTGPSNAAAKHVTRQPLVISVTERPGTHGLSRTGPPPERTGTVGWCRTPTPSVAEPAAHDSNFGRPPGGSPNMWPTVHAENARRPDRPTTLQLWHRPPRSGWPSSNLPLPTAGHPQEPVSGADQAGRAIRDDPSNPNPTCPPPGHHPTWLRVSPTVSSPTASPPPCVPALRKNRPVPPLALVAILHQPVQTTHQASSYATDRAARNTPSGHPTSPAPRRLTWGLTIIDVTPAANGLHRTMRPSQTFTG